MDLDTFRWLLSEPGQRLLVAATEAYVEADADPMAASDAVHRLDADPDHAAAALTQVSLRARAVAKLGADATRMYFTPEALEQATRARVATHRASRLATARPGSVVDLGCGIGSDLIAFSRAGLTAAGVDLDPLRAALAEANLAALGLPGAVAVADATQIELSGFGAVFADPARRSGRGRTWEPEAWAPPWAFVAGLIAQPAPAQRVVKAAPGIPHALLPDGIEAEWVSDGGDVTEVALWSPYLASCARRATVLGRGGLASLTEEDDPYDGQPRPVRDLGSYLYEPDGAVIRAGLVTALAAGVDGGLLDAHIAYVTSDASFRTPFAQGYRVLETLPYREKQLRQALRQRGVGTLTIKKRGVQVSPEALRSRLALRGDDAATLVLTRVAGVGTAILVAPFS